ncbi:MAG: serine hydrolase [Acidobacteriota bacterium]
MSTLSRRLSGPSAQRTPFAVAWIVSTLAALLIAGCGRSTDPRSGDGHLPSDQPGGASTEVEAADAEAQAEAAAIARWQTRAPLLTQRLTSMREGYGVGGLVAVVVAGDQILWAEGIGVQADGNPYSASTPIQLYSATKFLTSLTLASMVEDGLLDLDAPIGDMMRDAPPAWRTIPFFRLINHTAGLPRLVHRPEFEALAADPETTAADLIELLRPLPLEFAPGERSSYRQSGYAVAEHLLHEVTDASWPELVDRNVLSAAGLKALERSSTAAPGEPSAPLLTSAGWHRSTADDLAALFRALHAGAIVDLPMLERLLSNDRYVMDGYGLGTILETLDDVETFGHRGGGGRATIRFAPSRRVTVGVFTDHEDNKELVVHLADLLMREVALGDDTQTPISAPLLARRDAPAETLRALYRQLIEGNAHDPALAEWTLNRLGYVALRAGRVDDAVGLFQLNVEEFPDSPNVHDSLGEAFAERGDRRLAIDSYRRVLDLDPDNAHALERLGELEGAG